MDLEEWFTNEVSLLTTSETPSAGYLINGGRVDHDSEINKFIRVRAVRNGEEK